MSLCAVQTTPEPRAFTVAPSDLVFLLHDCIRCFYNKVALGVRRPSTPMPAIFTIFDRQQRAYFDGKPHSEIAPLARQGVLRTRGLSVKSAPLEVPGHDSRV